MVRPAAALEVREVTPATWADMERLFAGRGGPSACWCTVWRRAPDGSRPQRGPARHEAMAGIVAAGTPVGLLAYDGGEPVAWCSVAPRATFVPTMAPTDDAAGPVWSVPCLFVRRDHRGAGVMAALLDAAEELAHASGAAVLEAYPVDPASPSYGFGGRLPFFLARGYVETARAGTRRHVVRRPLPQRTPRD
ncbi:GNAT family N-acetyltransferase [Demequina rhizosphaerae]|uniref:GNAT family N-acetyltransferase n=1 Tax=Demequina rhizosphaerae TaxID=1638985 RepID=UPI000783FBED|nr:GNAT family N-acetyltransferase [Demequina rhizosphaerae]